MNSKEALKRLFDSYVSSKLYGINYKEDDKDYNIIEQDLDRLEQLEKQLKDGTLSDGYHTFNDLYYQRMILFATIVNQNKELAWKSLKHEDGELCFGGDWFIVGIDTPKGSYTYHYENKYWDLFQCQELEVGKKWDGHTSKDADRLLSLHFDAFDQLEKQVITLIETKNSLEKAVNKWQEKCSLMEKEVEGNQKDLERLKELTKVIRILKTKKYSRFIKSQFYDDVGVNEEQEKLFKKVFGSNCRNFNDE